jgi:hypothetical protein
MYDVTIQTNTGPQQKQLTIAAANVHIHHQTRRLPQRGLNQRSAPSMCGRNQTEPPGPHIACSTWQGTQRHAPPGKYRRSRTHTAIASCNKHRLRTFITRLAR